MGLFDLFFKRKGDVLPEKKSYNTQSLMEILSQRNDEIEKSFTSLAKERYNEISGIIDIIKSRLEVLDNHKMGTDRIDPQLLQTLLGNKKILSTRLHEICATLKTNMGESTDSIIRHYKNSRSNLADTISGTVENYKKIEYHFHKMVDPILKDINRIADIVDSFQDDINNFQKKKQEIASLENSVKEMEKTVSEKSSILEKRTIMEERLHTLEEERKDTENRLNSIVSSDSYRDFIKLIEAHGRLKRKLEENKTMTVNYMSPLQRAVRKFLKLVKEGEIVFPKHDNLSDLMTNYTIEEESMPLIRDAFTKMHSVIDKLENKADDVKRLSKRMDEILNTDILSELYQSKLETLHDLESIENQISMNKPAEKFELDAKLSKTDSDIRSTNNALQGIGRDLENTTSSIDKSRQSVMTTFKGFLNEDFSLS